MESEEAYATITQKLSIWDGSAQGVGLAADSTLVAHLLAAKRIKKPLNGA